MSANIGARNESNSAGDMLSAEQIRAGRALLGWSARELAEKADLHIATIQRMERCVGAVGGTVKSLQNVEQVFETAGVQFVNENGSVGVVLKDRYRR